MLVMHWPNGIYLNCLILITACDDFDSQTLSPITCWFFSFGEDMGGWAPWWTSQSHSLWARASQGGISGYVTLEEQLAIFLYISATGLTIQHMGEYFQWLNDMISKYFHKILVICLSVPFYTTYVPLPNANTPLHRESATIQTMAFFSSMHWATCWRNLSKTHPLYYNYFNYFSTFGCYYHIQLLVVFGTHKSLASHLLTQSWDRSLQAVTLFTGYEPQTENQPCLMWHSVLILTHKISPYPNSMMTEVTGVTVNHESWLQWKLNKSGNMF